MCVGISPPCSKCGAPARWKHMQAAQNTVFDRIVEAVNWIDQNMNEECEAKAQLLRILEGEDR